MPKSRHDKDDTFLPFEPLWEAAKLLTNRKGADEIGKGGLTLQDLAEMTGSTKNMVSKWRSSGEIGFHAADRAATAMGLHPSKVWGEAWYHAHGDFGKCIRMKDAVLFEGMRYQEPVSVS